MNSTSSPMSQNTCGWSNGGVAPMHMNSFAPISITAAPTSLWKCGTTCSAMPCPSGEISNQLRFNPGERRLGRRLLRPCAEREAQHPKAAEQAGRPEQIADQRILEERKRRDVALGQACGVRRVHRAEQPNCEVRHDEENHRRCDRKREGDGPTRVARQQAENSGK